MESVELKPCPFCAGKADVVAISVDTESSHWMVYVLCRKCGVSTATVRSTDRSAAVYKSVGKWNTRV